MVILFSAAPFALAAPPAEPGGAEAAVTDFRIIERPRVTIRYAGVSVEYAEAIARITESTYAQYQADYHFDMPDRLTIEVRLDR